jgi:hypothetical protein
LVYFVRKEGSAQRQRQEWQGEKKEPRGEIAAHPAGARNDRPQQGSRIEDYG